MKAKECQSVVEPTDSILLPKAFIIEKKVVECTRIVSLWIAPLEKNECTFNPGQFLMVYVFGVGEVALSIADNGGDQEKYLLTVRSVGSVTRVIEHAKEGDILGVRGPFGNGWPIQEASTKDILLIAGGIGLPPLWSTIPFFVQNRSCYGRISLLYGVRTPQDILYKDKLETLSNGKDISVKIAVELATARTWNGHIGNVLNLISHAQFSPPSTIVFVCGPEPMMRFCAYTLLKYGIAKENIYFSMERNMQCAIGSCGHCQFGPLFLCKNGPVFSYQTIEPFLHIAEI
ncbi:2-polyprenylphenol hydroxylase [Candidatus Methylacidiphilum fumarolicum]|uniref:2-polyprenylphenol hydroxylase or related flavodoxin oxidoreductase n=2 Tax=Candidatus Methylacidiphilum fumarolicum TaxID=591154 RepID=I0K136_METFB|nr:FAD/NAD(P)-binding protein [Candidatus Methylacidiphilum fumarolicum]MBW6413931.1 FAD/NAD(P)-binding protein [Candidatus Methylacidiphilum fumarolicum]TFE70480.1 2-polyprenylphenol hydroxylase [Candidatus Methylacidiphilum fumarolicum]TFE74802.1 2-polyprenylphenol hydroxylase [Candidatus Methylacidiphilum fumarolicum]TFE76048.1 2-polyprenylphenol hydroxylase [Candidatus Methylacidiphilum fumarolicum]TFE76368.1 2-polyprenylphenol hydroxylase [Candidatus Methylacidiphilum fumarolicum]